MFNVCNWMSSEISSGMSWASWCVTSSASSPGFLAATLLSVYHLVCRTRLTQQMPVEEPVEAAELYHVSVGVMLHGAN